MGLKYKNGHCIYDNSLFLLSLAQKKTTLVALAFSNILLEMFKIPQHFPT